MKCVKCGHQDHHENANYCANCGFELDSNYCTNNSCMFRNNSDEPITCKDTDCYCDHCGAETEYFRQGLIKPIDYSKLQPDFLLADFYN